jgi:hypothetical protein
MTVRIMPKKDRPYYQGYSFVVNISPEQVPLHREVALSQGLDIMIRPSAVSASGEKFTRLVGLYIRDDQIHKASRLRRLTSEIAAYGVTR